MDKINNTDKISLTLSAGVKSVTFSYDDIAKAPATIGEMIIPMQNAAIAKMTLDERKRLFDSLGGVLDMPREIKIVRPE